VKNQIYCSFKWRGSCFHIYPIQLIKGLGMCLRTQISSQPHPIIHLPVDVDLLNCEWSNENGVPLPFIGFYSALTFIIYTYFEHFSSFSFFIGNCNCFLNFKLYMPRDPISQLAIKKLFGEYL
jgi:hypothetical protein